jgi:hypothetical protein
MAIGAYLSSLTTFLLWLLPFFYPPASDFNATIPLSGNIYYLSKLWVNLIHIPLAMAGYAGITFIIMERNALKAMFGMIWLSFWGLIEMCGIASIILTVNQKWRTDYVQSDNFHKSEIKAAIESFFAIWDSLFFVLLICFLLGSLFLGWATWSTNKLDRIISILLLLAVPLTILIIISGYTQYTSAGIFVKWLYPVVQPVSRLAIGLYIWKHTWWTYHFPKNVSH